MGIKYFIMFGKLDQIKNSFNKIDQTSLKNLKGREKTTKLE